MDTQKQPFSTAASAAEPGKSVGKIGPHGESPACSGPFARVAPLIMSQPGALDLSEMLLRLRRREL